MIRSKELKVLQIIAFIIFINVSSCCLFKTDPADLRITSQSFPSQVTAGQRFNVSFTVGNYSNTDCNSQATTQSIVNLKMIKQSNQFLQVNNTQTLNPLDFDKTQSFTFSILIEGADVTGPYDLIFSVDPNNTSGDGYRNNNVFTSIINVVN